MQEAKHTTQPIYVCLPWNALPFWSCATDISYWGSTLSQRTLWLLVVTTIGKYLTAA